MTSSIVLRLKKIELSSSMTSNSRFQKISSKNTWERPLMTSDFRQVGRFSRIGRKSDMVGRQIDKAGTSDFFCTIYYCVTLIFFVSIIDLFHLQDFFSVKISFKIKKISHEITDKRKCKVKSIWFPCSKQSLKKTRYLCFQISAIQRFVKYGRTLSHLQLIVDVQPISLNFQRE